MKHSLIIFFVFTSLILGSCKKGNTQNNDVVLSAKDFADKMKTLPNAPIVDVRTPDEFLKGHIPNAQNVDWNGNDFSKEIAALDKSKPDIVLVVEEALRRQVKCVLKVLHKFMNSMVA
jgi:rhodanese-related sulfurtransferase